MQCLNTPFACDVFGELFSTSRTACISVGMCDADKIVQMAKSLGAKEVVGVCSSANHELVLQNGATRCVDYKDAAEYAKMIENERFDVIYDTATAADPTTNYWPDGI